MKKKKIKTFKNKPKRAPIFIFHAPQAQESAAAALNLLKPVLETALGGVTPPSALSPNVMSPARMAATEAAAKADQAIQAAEQAEQVAAMEEDAETPVPSVPPTTFGPGPSVDL